MHDRHLPASTASPVSPTTGTAFATQPVTTDQIADLAVTMAKLALWPSAKIHFVTAFAAADAATRVYGTSSTEDWDTDAMANPANAALFCNTPGAYLLWAILETAVAGELAPYLLLNDVTWIAGTPQKLATLGDQGSRVFPAFYIAALAAGDFVKVGGWHTGGGAVTFHLTALRLPIA